MRGERATYWLKNKVIRDGNTDREEEEEAEEVEGVRMWSFQRSLQMCSFRKLSAPSFITQLAVAVTLATQDRSKCPTCQKSCDVTGVTWPASGSSPSSHRSCFIGSCISVRILLRVASAPFQDARHLNSGWLSGSVSDGEEEGRQEGGWDFPGILLEIFAISGANWRRRIDCDV